MFSSRLPQASRNEIMGMCKDKSWGGGVKPVASWGWRLIHALCLNRPATLAASQPASEATENTPEMFHHTNVLCESQTLGAPLPHRP